MKQTVKMLSALRKLTLATGITICLGLSASAQSIDLKLKDVTAQTAVMELQKKYGYSVAVRSNEIDMSRPISVDLKGKSIEEVVMAIFAGQDVEVNILGKKITVAKAASDTPVQNITVKGIVKDETDQPVIGAAVFQKGSASNGVVTGLDGDYTITVPSNAHLVVSYIGYKDSDVAVAGNKVVNVTLAVDSELLEDAIVVGYGVASKKLVFLLKILCSIFILLKQEHCFNKKC